MECKQELYTVHPKSIEMSHLTDLEPALKAFLVVHGNVSMFLE